MFQGFDILLWNFACTHQFRRFDIVKKKTHTHISIPSLVWAMPVSQSRDGLKWGTSISTLTWWLLMPLNTGECPLSHILTDVAYPGTYSGANPVCIVGVLPLSGTVYCTVLHAQKSCTQSFRLSEKMMGPWAHQLGKWWARFQMHGPRHGINIYFHILNLDNSKSIQHRSMK